MVQVAVWALLPLSLLCLGCALLWVATARQQRRSVANPFARPSILLTFSGWLSVALGGLGIAVTSALFFAPLVLLVAAVVLISGVIRYFRSEHQYLIWSLAEAAERNIPLEKAARAFASERGGAIASTARRMADYLDAAMPLSVAMARSGLWVSSEVRMAADIGEKTGTLGPALKQANEQAHALDNLLGGILAKFFYLACILFVMISIVTFMMIKIVPTFAEMFEEFDMRLPAATQMLIFVSRFIVNYWFLLTPVLILLVIGVVIGLLAYVGVPLHSIPIARWFATPIDNAAILNTLTIAVERRQPIPESLLLLSGLARSARSRRRLELALDRMQGGAHWTDALQFSGLISKPQNAVIRSAERAGNLAWALREMADSTIRLTVLRAQAALTCVFPACLIGFGICVFFVAVGMLLPLFTLIGNLA